MRVLVADKDPYDVEALRTALQAPDLEVLSATDGAQALSLAREHVPDVVVAASSLGQMGGLALSRDLKTMAEAGTIPEPKILVLLERDADAWLANWSRCDLYRSKPIDPVEVERIVRELATPPKITPGPAPA
jgi:CheY-like chemotaxis protein